jgi:ABC-type uncharacterized transport system ATPase subunit
MDESDRRRSPDVEVERLFQRRSAVLKAQDARAVIFVTHRLAGTVLR